MHICLTCKISNLGKLDCSRARIKDRAIPLSTIDVNRIIDFGNLVIESYIVKTAVASISIV